MTVSDFMNDAERESSGMAEQQYKLGNFEFEDLTEAVRRQSYISEFTSTGLKDQKKDSATLNAGKAQTTVKLNPESNDFDPAGDPFQNANAIKKLQLGGAVSQTTIESSTSGCDEHARQLIFGSNT